MDDDPPTLSGKIRRQILVSLTLLFMVIGNLSTLRVVDNIQIHDLI